MIIVEGWLPSLLLGAAISFIFMVVFARSSAGRHLLASVGFKASLTGSVIGIVLHFVAFTLLGILVALVLQASGWVSGFDSGFWNGLAFLLITLSSFAVLWGHYAQQSLRNIGSLLIARFVPIVVIAVSLALFSG